MSTTITGISDASSAILIYKAGLFPVLLKTWNITIAESVFIELTKPGKPGADYFSNIISGNKVTTAYPPIIQENNPALERMGGGERDTILLFQSGWGNFIIIDDKKGARYCRETHIPYFNALLLPRILYLSGILHQPDYLSARSIIASTGRYSQEIRNYAEECTYNDIKKFLPD